MENEIYEKDYGEEFRERSDKSEGKDFLDTLMEVGFFQKYQEEMDKIPKRVVPKEKADYEYLLGECDAYVRQFGGRIRGEVDYQNRRPGGKCDVFNERWIDSDVGVYWVF